jgi:hypothetical protein
MSPFNGNSVSGVITLGTGMASKMDSGLLFAVNGGMVVNAMRVDSQVQLGGAYTMSDLPGGTAGIPLPGAFYGIDAVGWTSSPSIYKSIAIPQVVDLRTGNDTANMQMLPLW